MEYVQGEYVIFFLIALIWTITTETAALYLTIRHILKIQKIKIHEIILAGIFASGFTLPYFWFIIPHYLLEYKNLTMAGECFALIAEAIFYWWVFQLPFKKAFVTSLICNFVSFITWGVLILHYF
jgi:hypothetical protein